MTRPSYAHIDLEALRHNYRLAQSLAPRSLTLAVIKADGYGHGAVAVARALEPLVPAFAVACCEEAQMLRESGIQCPILILEGPFSADEVKRASRQGFWLLIESNEQVATVESASVDAPVTAWLKVDTGMHRLGLAPEELAQQHQRLLATGKVASKMVAATHLANADELDDPFTLEQIRRLRQVAEPLGLPLSIANSPGLLGWEAARSDWNRPGFMLYGNSPFPHPHEAADKLRPVMSFRSQVMSLRRIPAGDRVGYGGDWEALRPSLIATIPAGYGDGYPRTAASGTPVWIEGRRAPLAGRVSMDLLSVDVTDVPGVRVGSEVELWGEHVGVNEVAARTGTIGYELLARMPARVPRHYANT